MPPHLHMFSNHTCVSVTLDGGDDTEMSFEAERRAGGGARKAAQLQHMDSPILC
jgi:hypothetical protein